VQAVSFAIVGLLIATLRGSLVRERGLSRADPLTSLLNTRAFYEQAPGALALCRRKGRPVTLAYIDLDNFKAVNDTLGHQAGDDLLRRVSVLLRASTRPSDLSARLGGDEFALLLPELDHGEAGAALERLRSRLADSFDWGRCPVTVSIGAVTFNTVPEHLEDMVKAADSLMYSAKTEGKNRLRLRGRRSRVGWKARRARPWSPRRPLAWPTPTTPSPVPTPGSGSARSASGATSIACWPACRGGAACWTWGAAAGCRSAAICWSAATG
jgi:diguanylate cyclase (GGDEF)-like protein